MEIGDASLAFIDDAINEENPLAAQREHMAYANRAQRRRRTFWNNRRRARATRAGTISRSLGTKCISLRLRDITTLTGGSTNIAQTFNIGAQIALNADWTRIRGLYARVIVTSCCLTFVSSVHDQVSAGVNIVSAPFYVGYDSTTSTVPSNRADVLRFNKYHVFSPAGGVQKWAFKLGQAGSQIMSTDSMGVSNILGYIPMYAEPTSIGVNYGNIVFEFNMYLMDRR